MQPIIDLLPVFLLIFTRMTGLFMSAPLIGSRNIHPMARVGGAAALAFLLCPIVPVRAEELPTEVILYAGALVKELAVGWIIGFSAMLVFNAIQIAGQVLDVQMGFGVANVVDPTTSAQVPTMGQFQFVVAMLLFLSVNGHHLLLSALARSFELVPVTHFWFTPTLAEKFSSLAGEMFLNALRVGAPAIGALFLAEAALGMVARTVPQMNVFLVGIPMKIALGFVVVLAALPVFHVFVAGALDGMYRDLLELSRAMGVRA